MKPIYTLIRSSRKTVSLQVKDGEVIVRAPKRCPRAYIDKFVNSHNVWIERQLERQSAERAAAASQPKLTEEEIKLLKEEASQIIPERAAYYAKKIGVTYGRVTIRSQRTRWGSCSAKGNLNFNCLLMLMPTEVLDSVIVHELCHRKEMNHSERFYNEVLKVFPDYPKWDNWLKKNGSRFINMLPQG